MDTDIVNVDQVVEQVVNIKDTKVLSRDILVSNNCLHILFAWSGSLQELASLAAAAFASRHPDYLKLAARVESIRIQKGIAKAFSAVTRNQYADGLWRNL